MAEWQHFVQEGQNCHSWQELVEAQTCAMTSFIATIAPIIPALILTGLFVWALERNHRRTRLAPWQDDYRHHVDHDADARRSTHDLDGLSGEAASAVDFRRAA